MVKINMDLRHVPGIITYEPPEELEPYGWGELLPKQDSPAPTKMGKGKPSGKATLPPAHGIDFAAYWGEESVGKPELPTEPKFDLDNFREYIKAPVREVARAQQVFEIVPFFCFLDCMAIALNSKYKVLGSEIQDKDCTLSIFTLLLIPASGRKSSTLEIFLEPISRYSGRVTAEYIQEKKNIEAANAVIKRQIDKNMRALKAGADEEAIKWATQTTQQLEARIQEIPHVPIPYTNDISNERLVDILDSIDRNGISIVSLEGGQLQMMQGTRYSTQVGNTDPYKYGWNGEEIIQERVGRGSKRIPFAHVTTIILIQNDLGRPFLFDKRLLADGTLPRMLFWECPPEAQKIPIKMKDGELYNGSVNGRISQGLRSLFKSAVEHKAPEPYEGTQRYHSLGISKDAADAFNMFIQSVIDKGESQYKPISEWVGRAGAHTLKIAGLLHCALEFTAGRLPEDSQISVATMREATYFIGFMLDYIAWYVRGNRIRDTDTNADKVLGYIQEKGGRATERELNMRFKTQIHQDPRFLSDAAAYLTRNGMVGVTREKPRGGGRPSVVWSLAGGES
jgi:hypothetical protein